MRFKAVKGSKDSFVQMRKAGVTANFQNAVQLENWHGVVFNERDHQAVDGCSHAGSSSGFKGTLYIHLSAHGVCILAAYGK
jgi:hypothetical protein